MVLTTVALPKELHRELMLTALERETAAAELVRQAVEKYLRQGKKSRKGKS